MQKKHKKILTALAIVIILLRIGYLWSDFEIQGEYWHTSEFLPENSISVPFEKVSQTFIAERTKLNSLEFIFADISEGAEGVIDLTIESEQQVIYGSKISISNLTEDEWYPLEVNLPTEVGKSYEIKLMATNADQTPCIYIVDGSASAPESTKCYIDGELSDKQLQIRYGYLKQISILDKLFGTFEFALCCLGIYLIFKIFIKKWLNIKRFLETFSGMLSCNESDVKIIGLEMLLSFVLVENGSLPLDSTAKVVLYAFSFASCLNFSKRFAQIKRSYSDKRIKTGFIILDLYAAFSLVGNRLFLFPIDKKVVIGDILTFVVTVLWFVPLLLSGIFFYEKIRLGICRHSRKDRIRFGILITICLLMPSIIALYAFNPGISSYDSIACLAEYAHNVRNMQDWHPPFYVLLLKGIIAFWDSTYAVIFIQFLFWAAVSLELFTFLLRRGWRKDILLIVAIIIGSNAGNFLHLCTIWKDIPYAISLLWLSVLIGKLTLESSYYKNKKWIYIELIAALVLTCLLRQNGVVPYILTAGAVTFALCKNRRLVVSVCISLIFIFLIKGPLYDYIGVQKANSGGMYIGLGQDILGVYYSGGDVSENAMKIVNGLTDNDTGEFMYTPYYAKSSYNLDVKMVDFIKEYLVTFIKNPVMMTRAILCRQDALWSIFDGESAFLGCVNYHETMEGVGTWSQYYPDRKENYCTVRLSQITEYSASNPLIRIVEWRAGLSLLVIFVAVFSMARRRVGIKSYLILFPLFGQSLSLFLSTGWSDFRYYWPVNLLSVFVVFLVPAMKSEKKIIEKTEE